MTGIRGAARDNTIEAWREYSYMMQDLIAEQRDEINRLKQKINKLEQKLGKESTED